MTDLHTVSRTVHGVPESHIHCTLKNFDWSKESEEMRDALDRYLRIMKARLKGEDEGPAPKILMVGEPGNGKTHMALALYRWSVLRTDPARSCWLHFPSFCDRVKEAYGEEGNPMEEVREATFFLALDDIFGRDLTRHETDQILSRVISIVQRNQASLVATTNYPAEQIEAQVNPHEMSRLTDRGRIWQFEGPDRRRGREW